MCFISPHRFDLYRIYRFLQKLRRDSTHGTQYTCATEDRQSIRPSRGTRVVEEVNKNKVERLEANLRTSVQATLAASSSSPAATANAGFGAGAARNGLPGEPWPSTNPPCTTRPRCSSCQPCPCRPCRPCRSSRPCRSCPAAKLGPLLKASTGVEKGSAASEPPTPSPIGAPRGRPFASPPRCGVASPRNDSVMGGRMVAETAPPPKAVVTLTIGPPAANLLGPPTGSKMGPDLGPPLALIAPPL